MARGKFAFTIHPTDMGSVYRRWPATRHLPERFSERLLSFKSSFKVSDITGVSTPYNTAEGFLVAIPLTPRMWAELPQEYLVRRVVDACRLAEREGAKIIGLGAHSAIPGDAGKEIAVQVGIPITTGNSYTVAAALEGTREGARLLGFDLRTADVAVVGATGSIGACCARILARECRNLTLVGRTPEKLNSLAGRIFAESKVACRTSTDLAAVLPRADAIIAVSSAAGALIDPMMIKPGAVVCDVALPRDVDARVARVRDDVLVIDGGLIAVPGDFQLNYDVGLSPGTAWACLSETMLLALEERYEHFTLGRDLNINQIDEITALARKHGFKLARPRSFHKPLTDETIARIQRNAALRR
ncbi:MAG TPA: shikimate dehydrogenase [Symbiobacteriaceae bacterium]|jgi:predicted amino acid dehydrogenase